MLHHQVCNKKLTDLPQPKGNTDEEIAILCERVEAMGVKIMALIPARANSKGLPGKNIISLNNKPLLAYSIESAFDVRVFDHVIVSTDSQEIADTARRHGAETPFLRPSIHAEDHSLLLNVENHALEQMTSQGFSADIIVSLYPTNPFRRIDMVTRLIGKLLDGYRSALIGAEVSYDPAHTYHENDAGQIVTSAPSASMQPRRGIYSLGLFVGRWVSEKIPTWGMFVEEAGCIEHLIDIDTVEDINAAKQLIKCHDI